VPGVAPKRLEWPHGLSALSPPPRPVPPCGRSLFGWLNSQGRLASRFWRARGRKPPAELSVTALIERFQKVVGVGHPPHAMSAAHSPQDGRTDRGRFFRQFAAFLARWLLRCNPPNYVAGDNCDAKPHVAGETPAPQLRIAGGRDRRAPLHSGSGPLHSESGLSAGPAGPPSQPNRICWVSISAIREQTPKNTFAKSVPAAMIDFLGMGFLIPSVMKRACTSRPGFRDRQRQ
jgi:hypothetical protein